MYEAMKLPRMVLPVLLAFHGIQGSSQTLWREAKAGMSTLEISKMFPGLVPADKDDVFGDGIKAIFYLNNVMILGHSFQARFYFKDNRLKQVTLGSGRMETREAAILLYSNIFKNMYEKYGATDRDDLDKGYTKNITWIKGKVDITLFYLGLKDVHYVNIIYSTKIYDDKNNL